MTEIYKLIARIAVMAIISFFGSWYGWHQWTSFKSALIEQGKAECRASVSASTNSALIADAVTKRNEAVLQSSRAQRAMADLREQNKIDERIRDEIDDKAADDERNASPQCPPPTLKDAYAFKLFSKLKP